MRICPLKKDSLLKKLINLICKKKFLTLTQRRRDVSKNSDKGTEESSNVCNAILRDIWHCRIIRKMIQLQLKTISLLVFSLLFLEFLKGLFRNSFQVL